MKRIIHILFLFIFTILTVAQEPIGSVSRSVGIGSDAAKINRVIDQLNLTVAMFNYADSVINALKYIDWNLEDGWDQQEGRTGWDDDDKTLVTGLDGGSALQHGQEIHVRCTNKTGSLIPDMNIVYVIGSQGKRPIIGLANNKYIYKSASVLGVTTQDIATNSTGYVTTKGLVRDVNTSAWPDSTVLWLDSIDGGFTDIHPGAGLYGVTGFVVLYSHATEGILLVNFVSIPTLSGLSDVNARGNQANNYTLVWNSDSLFWEVRDSIATAALYLTDTYWDDLKAPFSTARRGALSKPDFDYDNVGLLFPQNDTAEIAYMILQFSHKRKNGSDIEPHIHWNQVNSNDVVWKIVYKWFDNGSVIPSTWTPLTEDHNVFTYTSGTLLQITDFPTIDGSSITGVSSIFLVKVYRDDNVDGGAGGGDVLGYEFDIHWEGDAVGSTHEYIK